METLLKIVTDDPFNDGRLYYLWEQSSKLCGTLHEAKDLFRVSGVLKLSLDCFFQYFADSAVGRKDGRAPILSELMQVSLFLKFACKRNDSNRRVLGQSNFFGNITHALPLIDSCERILILDLLVTLCAQDDPTGSNHVSIWNRDNLMCA